MWFLTADVSGGEMLAAGGSGKQSSQRKQREAPGPQTSDVGHSFETMLASTGFLAFH